MMEVTYGGREGVTFRLEESPRMVVVGAARGMRALTPTSPRVMHRLLAPFEEVLSIAHLGVSVWRTREALGDEAVVLRDRVRRQFRRQPSVRFAGRVLQDPAGAVPVLYTGNLFVKFRDDAGPRDCRARLRRAGLRPLRALGYATNAWHVAAAADAGQDVFSRAQELLDCDEVELCHPELLRPGRRRRAFPAQWHLKRTTVGGHVVDAHAHVQEAWKLARGKGVTIAVLDDGVDTGHPEFAGRGKVVHARDVSTDTDGALPRWPHDDHGTACAGVACADGTRGASGVAPAAALLPVRFEVPVLGAQAEADAFAWAADHGADVISCSWGPADGAWWDPKDPLHDQDVGLPDSTRLAIDHAVEHGRGGKGCVVVWAAGNGNESVDHDGYASYGKVIAVAACNDRGVRSRYSDHGKALWCAFPSNDVEDAHPLTPGITTTDRRGAAGYNPAHGPKPPTPEPKDTDFTNSFGGTSSAAPGVAGVAALVLAANPKLTAAQVRDVLRRTCDRIDRTGGRYDKHGHSTKYGYGRVNARKAVERARQLGTRP
jgi:subtilisin family serine protease